MTSDKIIPGNLNLSTLIDIPDIGLTIDGVDYKYSPHWRWSLLERSRFGWLYSEMLAVERKSNPTAKDLKRFTELQVTLCKLICPDLPEEVIKALPSDAQRSAIIIDFLAKSGNQATTLIPKEHAAMMSLIQTSMGGDSSSRGSKSSTEETPTGGRISRIRS